MKQRTSGILIIIMLFWATGSTSPLFHNHYHGHHQYHDHVITDENHQAIKTDTGSELGECVSCRLMNLLKVSTANLDSTWYFSGPFLVTVLHHTDTPINQTLNSSCNPRAPPVS